MDDSKLDVIMRNIISTGVIKMDAEEAILLCKTVSTILLNEPTVLDLSPPINICGDIHGQLYDLIAVFQSGGFDPSVKYLFLGDYVDRGPNSVEVICLLFAMKVRFPSNIFLLRGNHESPEMTEYFGFANECCTKLSNEALSYFYGAFCCLPISAIIGGKIFCVHGGLSPDLQSIDQIQAIKRPTPIPEEGLLADLLWSDPSRYVTEWGPNERGSTYTFGPSVVQSFLEKNGFIMLIRGHQMAQKGVDFPFAPLKTVATVFTASCYAGQNTNKAAYMSFDQALNFNIFVLHQSADINEEEAENE
ncbi:Ser/Thr protein phosphatase [Histomonas meleagridis]|uniref:Ser/Thr protein phosphatase n=1 Tax=Histomonas meleagridis TaxID=135588 RepID=UPI003559D236|nr:Ser/Thr protein phosphatase [Histomonas meleagridis]KAH0803005.1 Ser/Thr protein phosphatase [Histomonas meleagridis]